MQSSRKLDPLLRLSPLSMFRTHYSRYWLIEVFRRIDSTKTYFKKRFLPKCCLYARVANEWRHWFYPRFSKIESIQDIEQSKCFGGLILPRRILEKILAEMLFVCKSCEWVNTLVLSTISKIESIQDIGSIHDFEDWIYSWFFF